MVGELRLKPDFPRTAARFAAWWQRDVLDRPPVTVALRADRPYRGPASPHITPHDRRLDAAFQVEHAAAELARCEYPADNFPAFTPDVGPELSAALLGGNVTITAAATRCEPTVHAIEDWEAVIGRPLNFDDPGWRAVERMTELALQRGAGQFLVGVANLYNGFDTLAALRGATDLCLDLADDPQRMHRVARDAARVFQGAFERLWRRIAPAAMGCTTRQPIHHHGPCYVPGCDFWCAVGPNTARELIAPNLCDELAPVERSLFHLDGPQALRHLDLLLELPQITAVQWVFGPGQGPAARWIDVYRRIVGAGKPVQVLAQDAEDALRVLEALGPRGLWLTVRQPFDTAAAASAFADALARRPL